MRYWAYLVLKLAVVAGIIGAAWRGLNAVWPAPQPFLNQYNHAFARDLWYTTAVMGLWLAGVGLVYLAILDQRYRCRTCVRRLRMPQSAGSWNQVLFGAPRTDYICPFGHGTLRVPELRISGSDDPDWHPIENMWKELEELSSGKK
jgi:hypothetical protein